VLGVKVLPADRKGRNYVAGLTPEETAQVLCRAVGHWGSGAEYLMQQSNSSIASASATRICDACSDWSRSV
jgi:cation transport regulator ChaC